MDRHALTRDTYIDDTTAWLRSHGANYRTDIVIQQPGQPDVTARIGDTLVWDGRTISVESQEQP
jgi:hypothetical protein